MRLVYKILIAFAALALLMVVLAFGCVFLIESIGPGIAAQRIKAMTGFRLEMACWQNNGDAFVATPVQRDDCGGEKPAIAAIPSRCEIEMTYVADFMQVREKLPVRTQRSFIGGLLKSVQWNSGCSGDDGDMAS